MTIKTREVHLPQNVQAKQMKAVLDRKLINDQKKATKISNKIENNEFLFFKNKNLESCNSYEVKLQN